MKRNSFISMTVLLTLILVSCQTSQPTLQQPPERWMTVEEFSGTVDVKETDSGKWQTVSQGQMITPGSTIRTGVESTILVKTIDNSVFELGNNTVIRVAQFGTTLTNLDIQLDLQEGGGLFAASQETLEKGSFSVTTPVVKATLVLIKQTRKSHGWAAPARIGDSGYVGSMIVTIEKGKTPEEASTKVGVVSGNGTITMPGTRDSQQLQLEQYVEIDHNTSELLIVPVSILEEAKKMGITNLSWFINNVKLTPEPTKNPTRTPTSAPATWTPFPTFDQPTVTPTYSPLPTHRAFTPSPDWTPGPDGLSQEESANSGRHTYSASGVAYGSCIYSGYGDENEGIFTFTADGVTLAAADGNGSLTYSKIAENNYQLKDAQKGLETTLTFYIDGWDMVVTKNGEACSHQTFLIK